jgi:hypothetical protein
VAKLLLSDNLNLLAAICQGTCAGDAAAAVSTSVIVLLEQQGDEATETLIERLIRNKLQSFRKCKEAL